MGRHGYGGDFWHIGTFAEMVGMTIPEAMKYINEKKLKQKESADMKYGLARKRLTGWKSKKHWRNYDLGAEIT